MELAAHDFTAGIIDETVVVTRALAVEPGRRPNALCISGEITLCEGVALGATNALNGDKIIPLGVDLTGEVRLELAYRLGGGLGSLTIRPRRARTPLRGR